MMPGINTIVLALALSCLTSIPCTGAEQRVRNPHFTEWANAKPVGWSVLGDPGVWWTDSRLGAKHTASISCGGAGDGIVQRISVEPGAQYFIRACTGVSPSAPGEMLVRDVKSGETLLQRAADRPWLQEHAAFFTAKGAEVDLLFLSVKGGGLEVDNVILAPVKVDPTPSRVPIPDVPDFYSSFDPHWIDALGAINMANDSTDDVALLAKLRKRGVLLLSRVTVPNRGREVKDDVDAQADELLAHWMTPFHDTKAGAVPGGADGIIIDELEGFSNDAPRVAIWEKALGELRHLFPNKVIAVWGSNSIAALTDKGESRSRVMKMLATNADLFMIEIYQATCDRNPGPDWITGKRGYGRNLPEFAAAASVIGNACPDLLPKTVVCLVTAQNVGMNFDIGAEHNFINWLRVQMTNIPRLGRDGELGFAGVGQWVSYRARLSTLIAFEQYASRIFLSDQTPKRLSDDDSLNPVRDPSFEMEEASPWLFSGPARSAAYADTGLPDLHDKKVEHLSRFAEIGAGTTPGSVRQTVKVQPEGCYELSVYALPMSDKATVTVCVLDGKIVLATASETIYSPTKWWVRLPVTFQASTGKVSIEITTAGSDPGETIAVDFVDLAPMEGLNEPLEVTSVGSVDFDDLPTEIVIKGENLLPKDIVRIGREVYCDVTFVSTEELRVLIPELPAPGAYDLTVRHDDWLGEAQSVTLEKALKVER